MNRHSARSLVVWTLLWVGVAAVGSTMMYFGRRLSWGELAAPVACFLGIQIALYGGIILAREYRSSRIAIAIAGLCLWADFVLAGHFALRWKLAPGFDRDDLRSFAAIMAVVLLVFTLMPSRWTEHIGEVRCARCRHYHEGRDCSCGCHAGQFKYRTFQPPV